MDISFMQRAIVLAQEAATYDEVPVGAVVVREGKVIAEGQNRKERDNCALHHAEMVALEQACQAVGNWYLDDCDLYVTLEPCAMCAGAIVNSRLDRVVFGAKDPKFGFLGSLADLPQDYPVNHKFEKTGGVLGEECAAILSGFFRKKRGK